MEALGGWDKSSSLAAGPSTHTPLSLAAHLPPHRCSKNALLYVSYAFLIAAAVAAALGVALNCPGLTNPSLFLLLALLVMAWGGAWLITTGLKVGSDG